MNNEIKIVPENASLIDTLLNEVQRGCSKRLLSYEDIKFSSEIAESILDKLLKKQHRQNITALVAQEYDPFSYNYRGRPEHTQCTIRRGAKHWYVSNIKRTDASRKGGFRASIDLGSLECKKDHIYEFATNGLHSDHIV